jgi:hypothetical protein
MTRSSNQELLARSYEIIDSLPRKTKVAREYAWVLVHQQGRTGASSKQLIRKYYNAIFNMWSTTHRHNETLGTPNRSSISKDIQVGTLKQNYQALGRGERPEARNAGEPVVLRFSMNKEARCIECNLEDQDGIRVKSSNVSYNMGAVQMRINATRNYDNLERQRVSSYNLEQIVCATRRLLVSWAQDGSECDRTIVGKTHILQLTVASDYARSMASLFTEVIEGLDDDNQEKTEDSDSD